MSTLVLGVLFCARFNQYSKNISGNAARRSIYIWGEKQQQQDNVLSLHFLEEQPHLYAFHDKIVPGKGSHIRHNVLYLDHLKIS